DIAAPMALQLGADLVVRAVPGEGFEHLGRGRAGRQDAGDNTVIEMAADRDDFGSGGGSREFTHRYSPLLPEERFCRAFAPRSPPRTARDIRMRPVAVGPLINQNGAGQDNGYRGGNDRRR